MIGSWRQFLRDRQGSVVIETAIIAPVLILLSVGAFQTSQIVARQHELQAGADQAAAMALAGWSDNDEELTAMSSVIQASLGLDGEQIAVERKFRCGVSTTFVETEAECAEEDIISTFLDIQFTDQYVPLWAKFGVSEPLDFSVQRTVQVS